MRLIDIDIAIKELEKEGIDEMTDQIVGFLCRAWHEQGEVLETPVSDHFMRENVHLKDEVAQLQKIIEEQDRNEVKLRQAHESVKGCFDALLDKRISESVSRGQWALGYGAHVRDGLRINYVYCSECGKIATVEWSYCPNCGAKMGVQE